MMACAREECIGAQSYGSWGFPASCGSRCEMWNADVRLRFADWGYRVFYCIAQKSQNVYSEPGLVHSKGLRERRSAH